VVPEARGTGLGGRLLEEALAYARQRGLTRIYLWSFATLTDALRLYERAGFRTTETRTTFVWGAERTEVRMHLALGA
jgi:GNAT superfamily N-acetyltransferase